MTKEVPDVPSTTAQEGRRWPFVAVLLSVFILGMSPWLYWWIVPKVYGDQKSGNGPLLTLQDVIFNPFGPDHTIDRAKEILKCANHGWVRPSSLGLESYRFNSAAKACPVYFHLIQKDLAPWKENGINRENIEMAKPHGAFRIVIWDGNLYFERYTQCFANRGLFTVWGILLFLEKYKGQVPDVEFMFSCGDKARIVKSGSHPNGPPIMFAYSSNSERYDIPFPDWSFWGWSELLILNWSEERERIVRKSGEMDWNSKSQKPYWRGNPYVGMSHRPELLKCDGQGVAELRHQDWGKELSIGKQNSKLEEQCTHKYMIYIEGNSWSVSLKYILSCGSPTLVISPEDYDFFSRGLQEGVHYLPVRPPDYGDALCRVIQETVQSAEQNVTKAMIIGKAGQDFMQNELDINNVYDYVFHLIREYANLQRFQPSIEGNLHLVTLDQVRCIPPLVDRRALEQAMKVMPLRTTPCSMPDVPPEGFKAFDWENKVGA